ncbi:MAG TPA: DUF5665 domain-containing protein [Candidatus Saccharimonadia bacterium]|nr:DUF5665 domain-containing protein [Candidatus Saccharimonadia bacterium]
MRAKTEPASRSKVDHAQLGRAVEQVLVQDYIELLGSTRAQIWGSFVRGIFMGLGSVIGATLVVAVLIALLHVLGGLPVVGHYLQGAGQTIEHK